MNNNLIEINGKQIEQILYKDQPVVTLRMVDELHLRVDGTAGRNFRQNKNHFILGEDYFELPYDEWSKIIARRNSSSDNNRQRNPTIFLTQSGYLLLVKSFTDDLSWKVQRQLVNSYFALKEIRNDLKNINPNTEIDKVIDQINKLKRARPILSDHELYFLKKEILKNCDYDEPIIKDNRTNKIKKFMKNYGNAISVQEISNSTGFTPRECYAVLSRLTSNDIVRRVSQGVYMYTYAD